VLASGYGERVACERGGGKGREVKVVAVFPEQRRVKLVEHPAPSLQTRPDVKLRMPSRRTKNVVTVE
jgi:hypothetical protein